MAVQQANLQTESWHSVIRAISALAVPLGRDRGVQIDVAQGDDRIDGQPRFTVIAHDRGAVALALVREQRAVECHCELENGLAWWCRYQIEPDGLGPAHSVRALIAAG